MNYSLEDFDREERKEEVRQEQMEYDAIVTTLTDIFSSEDFKKRVFLAIKEGTKEALLDIEDAKK